MATSATAAGAAIYPSYIVGIVIDSRSAAMEAADTSPASCSTDLGAAIDAYPAVATSNLFQPTSLGATIAKCWRAATAILSWTVSASATTKEKKESHLAYCRCYHRGIGTLWDDK